ncbi:transmembrane emp24 domain-containing protein 7-like [Babylonia areolata]|uniref:transmembrane emp24 domain-containing protein 7-like n=1 Tax=Babylonia areolata TaxID=304850 RepID=UPI003FD334C7
MGFRHLVVLFVGLLTQRVFSSILTFELPDKEKMCFYEHIDKGVQSTFMFQVVVGGNNDVDLQITAPNKQVLYNDVKKQYGSFTWVPELTGPYSFCFSNEFSSFTHKLVFFAMQVGEDKLMAETSEDSEEHATAMTLMESASENIHSSLTKAASAQIYFRNREAGGRQFAENLNLHVILWSIGETVAVLVVGLGQVMVLRSFFSGPSSSSRSRSANGSVAT